MTLSTKNMKKRILSLLLLLSMLFGIFTLSGTTASAEEERSLPVSRKPAGTNSLVEENTVAEEPLAPLTREYDPLLSKDENHFEDLVSYYGIDASAARKLLSLLEDTSSVMASFADMDFYMSRVEAERCFSAKLAEIFISYNNFAIRSDRKDGLRYYFDVNEEKILAIDDATVEVGALVSLGKTTSPVLDGCAYDYKLVAYDGVMGKDSRIYTDENTFAVTVVYTNAQSEQLCTDVLLQGYVKLTFSDGTEAVYYVDTSDSAPYDLFNAYTEIVKADGDDFLNTEGLKSYVLQRMDAAYFTSVIYLNAAVNEGGNGSAEAPFKYFEDALSAFNTQMHTLKDPVHLVLSLADGIYSVDEAQVLDGSGVTYPYTDFAIVSENGRSILTTAVNMEGDFVYEGNNVYTYQFSKDAEGNYPAFRYLLVDGERANIAYNGCKYAVTEEATLTGFDRTFEGVWYTAMMDAVNGALSMTSPAPANYAGRSDLLSLYEYYRPRAIAYGEIVNLYRGLDHTSK